MNSDSQIVIFKPLTEIVDFHGRRYYTENTVEELEDLMDNNDRIFFPFSNRGVRVAQIVDYGPADSETVTSEWTIRELTDSQRRIFEASKKGFLEFWGWAKPLTNKTIASFVALAKDGNVATFGR